MKSCNNQWIISKIITQSNQTQIIYWNTSLELNNNDNDNNDNNKNNKKIY